MLSEEAGLSRDEANAPRFAGGGHYESWFLRANDPEDGRHALWIRYTIFSPKNGTQSEYGEAQGELWAAYFDARDAASPIAWAHKENFPIAGCTFAGSPLAVDIAGSRLSEHSAQGNFDGASWDLRFDGHSAPLLLLAPKLYKGSFPKAKALVPQPQLRFSGAFSIQGPDGEERTIELDRWQGSQNHNWGIQHTDRYAWGQCIGFEDHPDTVLELSTAQVDLGPLQSPWLTPLTLRHEGQDHSFGTIPAALRNHGHYGADTNGTPWPSAHPTWRFAAKSRDIAIRGKISAPAEHFVALPYRNPPGGTKVCLNSKIATCTLELRHRGRTTTLRSNAAAFEMLADVAPKSIRFA